MELNLTSVVLFVAGTVLIYAGVKDIDPRTVVTESLNGRTPVAKARTRIPGTGDTSNFGGGGGSFAAPPSGGGGGLPYTVVSV